MSDETAAKPESEVVRLSDGTEIEMRGRAPVENCGGEASDVPRPRASWPLMALATIAVLAVMYVARDVIVPVAFALMLALLLRPLLRRMKHWRIPNGVSALILVAVVVLAFLAAIWGLADNAQRWLTQAPETIRRVKKMLPEEAGPISDLKETSQEVSELGDTEESAKGDDSAKENDADSEVGSSTSSADSSKPAPAAPGVSQDMLATALGVSTHFVGASVIVFVLCYFLLALSDQLIKQAVEIMPSFCEKRNVVQLVHNVEQGISRYLATITVINLGLGAVTALAMWLMGIPNPILWGVMVAALNYVPHVGAFICLVVLFFVGTITHESLAYGAAVAGVFVLLTSAESYFITPMVLSKSLQLSPLAVILAILFWGWLWGVGGGLLAAPLLAVLKIVCDQFESLRPLALFLSGETNSGTSDNSSNATPAVEKQAA